MTRRGQARSTGIWTADPAREPAEPSDLIARCRRGDERAYTEVYRLYAGRLFRHLRVLLGPTIDAEDVLQMVFEQAFKNLDRFAGRSSFSTWLHGIAVNVAMNARRARGRRLRAMATLEAEPVTVEARVDPERQVSWRIQAERLERLLARVSETRRAAFLLYYVEQLSLEEVAAQLGVRPATAWARARRARDELIRTMRRQEKAADARRRDRHVDA